VNSKMIGMAINFRMPSMMMIRTHRQAKRAPVTRIRIRIESGLSEGRLVLITVKDEVIFKMDLN
jgi:hypothetical protein